MPEQSGTYRFVRQSQFPKMEDVRAQPSWQLAVAAAQRNQDAMLKYLEDQQQHIAAGHSELAGRINELSEFDSFAFFQDNAAAGQTNVALSNGMSTRGYVAVDDGSVVGIAVHSNGARVAGTLTAEPTINGVGTGLLVSLDGTNTLKYNVYQNAGLAVFKVGDLIGCRITTDAGWLPATADIDVAVAYLYQRFLRQA